MAILKNKAEELKKEKPEKEKIVKEVIKEWFLEEKEGIEKKELTEQEQKEKEKLKEEIEKVQLAPQKEIEIKKQAKRLKKGTVKAKISHLLALAQSNGLSYAIKVARKTKDALIIDLFHDILAKNGLFKKFFK